MPHEQRLFHRASRLEELCEELSACSDLEELGTALTDLVDDADTGVRRLVRKPVADDETEVITPRYRMY